MGKDTYPLENGRDGGLWRRHLGEIQIGQRDLSMAFLAHVNSSNSISTLV
jgi:hypothetical protein